MNVNYEEVTVKFLYLIKNLNNKNNKKDSYFISAERHTQEKKFLNHFTWEINDTAPSGLILIFS